LHERLRTVNDMLGTLRFDRPGAAA
jgi:hypothetical protein